MSRFVLTAQLQLQAPRNTRQVVNQMQQQLQNVNVQINPVINNQALSNANAQLTKVSASAQSVSKNLRGASRSAESFGSALGAAARRFASITLATGFFLGITRAMGSAVGRAVEFEREMLKISQVTGKSVRGLQNLSNEVTKLATTFGVSSEEILGAARTLSQAGLAADQVTKSLKILAQTDLAATFDNIADTTEGAVALINQFRKEVRAAGSEAKFLENALDAINAVSKNFAVESADLISVVRRTGGVFEAAGGQLNELIALFTSVRSTTRETADTIATGFRTIFTRIQRTETIDSLKELGIVLQDTTGKFVGPLEAVKRLSAGLAGLDPRDFRFNEIVEQLGGFRQIGKVIPLIKQYSTSVEALAVANNSMGSTAADAATAQQGLGNQFAQLKEKFDATIRSIADGDTFRSLAEGAIRLAESILKIVDALEPLMPMLTALAAFKLGQIAVPAFGRFAGVTGRNQGGKIYGFNKGGFVPGTGNRDTVPAMLTPGEFVIRKSSVNKIGASRLAEMNGYNKGGPVYEDNYGVAILTPTSAKGDYSGGYKPFSNAASMDVRGYPVTDKAGQAALLSVYQKVLDRIKRTEDDVPYSQFEPIAERELSKVTPVVSKSTPNELVFKAFNTGIEQGLIEGTDIAASYVKQAIPSASYSKPSGESQVKSFMASINEGAKGNMFEQVMDAFGEPFDEREGDPQRPFDFLPGQFDAMRPGFDEILSAAQYIEAKASQTKAQRPNIAPKIVNQRARLSVGDEGFINTIAEFLATTETAEDSASASATARNAAILSNPNPKVKFPAGTRFFGGRIGKYNKGGSVDTVPAMLTPGEYVINKKSAQQIGYGNLNRMNKQGVANFNSGGPVQHFAFGGGPTSPNPLGAAMSGGGGNPMAGVSQAAQNLVASINTLNNSITAAVDDFTVLQTLDDKIILAVQPLATAINQAAQQIPTVITTMKNSFVTASEAVTQSTAAFAQGFSTIDDLIREQLSASTQRIVQGAADFATGLATIDDTLKQTLSTALTSPMTAAAKQLETEMKAVGTEIKSKAKIFDTLKDDVENLAKALQSYTKLTSEASDDLGTLKDDITFMAEALMIAGERIIEAGDDLSVLKDDIGFLGMAINQTANQLVENSDDLDILKAPASQMAASLGKGMSAMTHFTQFMGKLNGAIIQMTQNIQAGIAPINMTSQAFADTPQKLTELEMKIEQLEQQLAQVIAAAQKAGVNLQNTGVMPAGGAAKGGAAAGGMMMGGGGQVANNLMMAGMAAGMLAQSMTGVSEETKAFIMDLSMVGGMLGMLAMSASGGVASMALATSTRYASIKSRIAAAIADDNKTRAAKLTALADDMKSKSAMAAGIAMGLIAAAATFVIMRMNFLGRQAEELGDQFKDAMSEIREGGGDRSLDRLQARARAALDMEAKARESTTGALIGATIAAVVAIGALALAPVTLGASLVIFGAAVAGGAVAGQQIAESMTTAAEALTTGSDMLVASLYHSSIALGELSIATKQLELEQKEGVELLSRQNQIFSDFSANAAAATTALSGFLEFESTAAGRGLAEEMDGSEFFGELRDMTVDAAKELQEAAFQQAQQLKSGITGAIDEMKAEGATMSEIFDSQAIKTGLDNYELSVFTGLALQMKLNGMMKREAKVRLGLADVAEDQLTSAQRQVIAAQEAVLIQEKAAEDAEKARKALVEAQEARLKAEEEAEKAAEQKLKADIAIAQASAKAAQALDLFAVEMLGFGSTLDSVMVEFGALTGSVKQYKDQNEKLIASLTTGTVTPEAEAAAMATAGEFGIEAEVAGLMDRIKETERIRKILTEKGMKEFAVNLNDTASELKIDEFLSDAGIDLSGLDENVREQIRKMFEDGLTDSEISEITDLLNAENENQIKVLQELAKAQNQYLSALFQFGDAFVKARGDFIKAFEGLVEVQLKGAERIAKAQGREMTRGEVAGREELRRRAPLQAAGLVGGGVAATTGQLERNRIKQQELAERIKRKNDRGEAEATIKLQNEQKKLNQESALLRENLKKLSDQSALAAVVMGDIEKERGKRETVQGLIKEFTFASNKQRAEIDRNFVALQRVLATGNLNAIPDEMRGAVGGLLDRLKDIELAPGMTGGDISKRFEMQMANALKIRATGRPLTQEEMRKIYESTDKEQKLIDDLRAINAEEQAAAAALAQNQDQSMQDLIAAIQALITQLQQAKVNAGDAAGAAIAAPAEPMATGGVVYASEGQPIFSPKGTDTVPAMLTPGEFVVNRKAASRNMGALSAINSGKVQYLNQGGPVTSWKNAPSIGYKEALSNHEKKYYEFAGELQAAREATSKFADSPVNVGTLYGSGAEFFGAMGVPATDYGAGWNDYVQPRAGKYDAASSDFFGFGAGSTFKRSLAGIPLLVKALLGHDSGMLDATNARAGFSKVLPYLGTSEGWEMLPEVKMFADGDWNYQKNSLTPGNGFFQRGWSTVSTSGGTYTRGAGSDNYSQMSFSYDTAGLTEALENGTVVDYLGGPDANRVKWIGGVETINRIQNAFNDFKQRWEAGKIHPDWAYNQDGKLFYNAPSAGGYPEIPSASMAKQFLGGYEYGFNWLNRLPMAIMPATEKQFKGLFDAMLDGGYESELDEKIMTYAKASNIMTKTPGLVGQALRDLTDPQGAASLAMKDIAEGKKIEDIQKAAARLAKITMGARDKAPIISEHSGWIGSTTNIFKGNEDAGALGKTTYGVNPFNNGIWKRWFGMVKENLPPTGQAEIGRNYLTYPHDWIKDRGDFSVPEVQALLDEANALADTKDIKADKIDAMRKAIASRLGTIASVVEGDNTAWAAEILGDAKFQQEQKEKDEDAKEQAIEEEAKRVQAKNLAVFYGNNAQKAAAMEKVLKKDPTVAGAPWPVWRIPPYAKNNIDPEGVFNPKTEKNISPPFVVAALKRSGQNFDALFTYFKDMSFDLRGLAGSGIVTGAGADGKLVYDVNKIVDADNLGDKTKAALARWSNSTADQWYPFDAEQMALIRIFFGKNLEKGLTNIQSDTRNAIADASIIFERAMGLNPWENGPWANLLGNPNWLKAAMKLRAGNQDNEELGPIEGFQPVKKAKGGLISGVDWSPKGTDTVPAMLTPGEFVMRKSAVDKYGLGFMQRINSGKGSTGPYFQEGGSPQGYEERDYYRELFRQYKEAPYGGEVDIATWLNGTERTYAGDMETIASALGDRGAASAYSAEKTAQQLLGRLINVTLPADIGGMVKLLLDNGLANYSLRNGSMSPRGLLDISWHKQTGGPSGYVTGSVLLSQPWEKGLGFSREDFAKAFGDEAAKKYYPTFKNIYDNPALDALYMDDRVGSSPRMQALKEGKLVDLVTYARSLTLQVETATQKFFNEVGDLFNRVSMIPTLTPKVAKSLGFEQGGSNGQLTKGGQDTGIWAMGTENFNAHWLALLGNPTGNPFDDMYQKNRFLNYMSWILPPSQYTLYERAKRQAKINSLDLGSQEYRNKWMEKAEGFNTGGSVPGRGNKDTIPAMLTPGEFVMRKSAVDKYGSAFMSSINSGLAYFAEGGPVGFASSQFEKDGISPILEDMSHSLTSIDGSNQNILVGQRSLQRNQNAGFGAVEGGIGSIGPEINTRFDDLVNRLDGAFFNIFDGYQFNSGGGVPGSGSRDTVPAMLTPGEFVMRKSAVQKYGLGFMRAINNSSPSVRVGRGVQYKHEGDVMGAGSSIDFSGLSNSISQLGNQVSTSLSAFESAFLGFSKLSSMISDTINSIANLNITHTVNISGSLSIPGFSQQAIDGIVKVISEQITNSTDGKIRRALRKFKRDQDNRT